MLSWAEMATTCWHCHSSHKPMPMTFICSESWGLIHLFSDQHPRHPQLLTEAATQNENYVSSLGPYWSLCLLNIILKTKDYILTFSNSQKLYSHFLFIIYLFIINSLEVFWLWFQYSNTWKKWSCVKEKLDTSNRQKNILNQLWFF